MVTEKKLDHNIKYTFGRGHTHTDFKVNQNSADFKFSFVSDLGKACFFAKYQDGTYRFESRKMSIMSSYSTVMSLDG